jgi:hypothetical protein
MNLLALNLSDTVIIGHSKSFTGKARIAIEEIITFLQTKQKYGKNLKIHLAVQFA